MPLLTLTGTWLPGQCRPKGQQKRFQLLRAAGWPLWLLESPEYVGGWTGARAHLCNTTCRAWWSELAQFGCFELKGRGNRGTEIVPFSQRRRLKRETSRHPKEANDEIGNGAKASCIPQQPVCWSRALILPCPWASQCTALLPSLPGRVCASIGLIWEDVAKRG